MMVIISRVFLASVRATTHQRTRAMSRAADETAGAVRRLFPQGAELSCSAGYSRAGSGPRVDARSPHPATRAAPTQVLPSAHAGSFGRALHSLSGIGNRTLRT